MFIVPNVPTFKVWMGLASYCGGEAGEAKCSTYRTSPPRKMPWFTSICLNSKSGWPSNDRRFSRDPVMKLSSASTRVPRSRRASHRCDPMNPAPPETTALGLLALLAADTPIREPEAAHDRRVVYVAAVDDNRLAHRGLEARQVEVA